MSENSYAQLRTEVRRLALLQLLAVEPSHTLNDALLQELAQGQGYDAGTAAIQEDLRHLAQTGCVALKELPGPVYVATLRRHGEDVSRGAASAVGVAKPRAGAL